MSSWNTTKVNWRQRPDKCEAPVQQQQQQQQQQQRQQQQQQPIPRKTKHNKSGQCRILTILSDIQPSIEHDWSFVLGAGAPHDISKEKVATQITKARKRQKKTEKDRKRQKKTKRDKKRLAKNPTDTKPCWTNPCFTVTEKCVKIVFFSLRRRDPVLELQFPTPLRVVLLCFATQSPQIALEWLRQGCFLLWLHA